MANFAQNSQLLFARLPAIMSGSELRKEVRAMRTSGFVKLCTSVLFLSGKAVASASCLFLKEEL